MALLDSLLSAIVRAEGDALVMHVGERPYVVVDTQTINISTHGMNLDTMTGMLNQLLPADSLTQLEEFGAVEYKVPQTGDDRFSVVAARGGEDIWIEIRRRRPQPAAVAAPPPATPAPQTAPVIAAPEPQPVAAAEAAHVVAAEPIAEPIPEPVAEVAPEPIAEAAPEPVAEAAQEPIPVFARAMPAHASAEPIAAPPVLAAPEPEPEPVAQAEPIAALAPEVPRFELVPPPAIDHVDAVAEDIAPVIASADVEAVLPLESALEAWRVAAAIEPVESVESIEAAMATIELLEPVEQILEEAPKIAALAESLEVQQVQQVHQVQQVQEVQAVHATHEVQMAREAQSVQAPAQAERLEPVEPKERLEPIEPIERFEPTAHLPEPGHVLPMTRTVRIEVPPRTTSASGPTPARAASGIDRLLRVAAARGASTLFLTSDSRPWIRVEGDLRFLDSESPLSRADVESAILEIAPEQGQESIGRGEATEWIAEFEGVGRIRCTTFADHRGPGVLLRMIATRAATAEQLGLAREVQALATEPQGLVLVAGPRASGKSTLISALVDLVNRQRAEYVITLERQIRLVHDNRLALVSQREIRGSADDSVVAARAALRENPDVLVVDDLVSSHMVPLLLTAASEGLLIFVSIAAPSTADAVARFVELAPPEMRKAVQSAMAESFRGAVAQVLLKKAGGGLVSAREVLLATAPVTRVIGEGQLGQLPLTLESGRKHGMVSFTETLADFVRSGTVDVREAFRKAPDRPRLLEKLKRDGIDTTVVERLA
jgi:twitching motility protein PilT